jgi:hypothetical protein
MKGREGELAGAIVVAHWFANERLNALEPSPPASGP